MLYYNKDSKIPVSTKCESFIVIIIFIWKSNNMIKSDLENDLKQRSAFNIVTITTPRKHGH